MIRIIATCLTCLTVIGCATQSQVEKDLNCRVPLVAGQTLLRDVLAELGQDVQTRILIDSNLSEVADLSLTYVSAREQERRIPLAIALDIITMQVYTRYGVSAAWRIEDDHILVYFAGTEEEYKTLRMRDK